MFSAWLSGMRKQKRMLCGRFTPRLEALEERAVPATVTWVGGSGDWNLAANWDTGTLPGPQDDAVIDRSGISVTHSAGTHRINSLLTANGTFQLTGGTLDVGTTVRGNSSFQLRAGRLANATVAAGTTVTGTGSQIELDRITVAAGATPKMTVNFFEGIQTMTAYIVQVSLGDTPAGTVEYQTIFAVGGLLFIVTLGMNVVAHRIMRHFQERYE